LNDIIIIIDSYLLFSHLRYITGDKLLHQTVPKLLLGHKRTELFVIGDNSCGSVLNGHPEHQKIRNGGVFIEAAKKGTAQYRKAYIDNKAARRSARLEQLRQKAKEEDWVSQNS
jgi:hypothetical protein